MDAKKLKSLVKRGSETEKVTFGTDPKDPWSAKANISETALLNRYLKSRGINPGFVNKDQKVAHSKTNQFKIWMRAHINDTVKESVDAKDTVTFDIPLLIRVLEFAREELKSDILLHKMVERLISIRGKGTLTMNQYGRIVKEEFQHLPEEQIDEISKELANRYMHSAFSDRKRTDDKMLDLQNKQDTGNKFFRSHKKIGKLLAKSSKRTAGIDRALNRITKEESEPVEESLLNMVMGAAKDAGRKATVAKSSTERKKDTEDMLKKRAADDKAAGIKRPLGGLYSKEYHPKANEEVVVEGSAALRMAKALQKAKQERELKDQSRAAREKQQTPPVKENMEPLAASAQACDCANTPDDVEPPRTNKKLIQMSKAANMVKSIHKKAVYGESLKEDLYDTEKEDKAASTVKKPKVQKPGTDEVTREQPQAAAVLKGGKTLTGEPRDTIEIDPMMKMRKQTPDSQKSI